MSDAPPATVEKAEWKPAYINDLPDSSFFYIEPGGEKDEQGKTKPRKLRHFPYKDAEGNIDKPHVVNALQRIPQATTISSQARSTALAQAKKVAAEIGVNVSKAMGLVADASQSEEEKRAAQAKRASLFGIAALEKSGERLTAPEDFPSDLSDYGDPVNLLFPLEPQALALKSIAAFRAKAGDVYEEDVSKGIVHTRIVEGVFAHGQIAKWAGDDLDKLLPVATAKRMEGVPEEVVKKAVLGDGEDEETLVGILRGMIAKGIQPGTEFEPRFEVKEEAPKGDGVEVKKDKSLLNAYAIERMVRKAARANFHLFGPFEPPRWRHDRPENHIWVPSVFPNGTCVVENEQAGRMWRVPYSIKLDGDGFYIAELTGTPVPTLPSYTDIGKVTKAAEGAKDAAEGETVSIAKSLAGDHDIGMVETPVVFERKATSWAGVLGEIGV